VVGLGLGAEYDTKTIDHIQSVSLSSGPYACGDVCKLSGKAEYLGSGKAMKYSGLANFQPKSKYATKLKATLSHAVEAGGPKLSYDAGVEQAGLSPPPPEALPRRALSPPPPEPLPRRALAFAHIACS